MFLLCSSANGPKKHQQFIYSSWDKKAWQTAVLHWKATKNGIIGHVYCIFMTAAVRDWFSSILQHLGLPLWAVLSHPTAWLSWSLCSPCGGLALLGAGGHRAVSESMPGMVLLLSWQPGARMAMPIKLRSWSEPVSALRGLHWEAQLSSWTRTSWTQVWLLLWALPDLVFKVLPEVQFPSTECRCCFSICLFFVSLIKLMRMGLNQRNKRGESHKSDFSWLFFSVCI